MKGAAVQDYLHNSLRRLQDLRWFDDPSHNVLVTGRLTNAYRSLRACGSDPDAYLRAAELASSCFSLKMSARQQMQTSLVLGRAFAGGGAQQSALMYFDQAIETARRLHNWKDYAEICFARASATSELFHYHTTVSYLNEAIDTLRTFNIFGEALYIALEADMLITHALAAFALEDYAAASQSLDEAEVACGRLTDPGTRPATIAWVRAILCRWLGEPAMSYSLALEAASAYRALTSLEERMSWGRLQIELADIILDLVEAPPARVQRVIGSILPEAEFLTHHALQYTRQERDAIGEGLALLARARYYRVTGRRLDNVQAIERALKIAAQTKDLALEVQSYTALGFEFHARHEHDSSVNCFHKALDTVGNSDISVMAAPARRALTLIAQDRNYL